MSDIPLLQPDPEGGGRVEDPTAALAQDTYLLRIADNSVSMAIKISHQGVFGATWVAAEAATTFVHGGDPGRLSLAVILLVLHAAGLLLQVFLAVALGRPAGAYPRRHQMLLVCVAALLLVCVVVVSGIRAIKGPYQVVSQLRGTATEIASSTFCNCARGRSSLPNSRCLTINDYESAHACRPPDFN
ncbi:hypothetical protein Taro_039131 [Colocasia esculenta]|uniref:Uncharacterized protein n=1 Tax=Colocasia esculenta TaxID=4460 RepID=A0A843W9V5_COLES|nr:hypothetical protein [Colocasia esculenta]